MNLHNIFNALNKTDPEFFERVNSRRKIMKQFKNIGGKLALTAIPFALGSVLNKAYGQTPQNIIDVLNFALKLEYLESDFYNNAISNPSLIDATEAASFEAIRKHEAAHVNFLVATITASGGTPIAKPLFDFEAGGLYHNVFVVYATFLTVAQIFEDTGVRAYKGQAKALMSNHDVLTAAMRIHSVEGRHAAHVRKVRLNIGDSSTIKPWITGKNPNGSGATAEATYNGEDNTVQLGINIEDISNVNNTTATESFDEPLSTEEVNAILDPFIL